MFEAVPFHLGTCTLLQSTGEAEQAAFTAHLRVHPIRADFWAHAPAADWILDVHRSTLKRWRVAARRPAAPPGIEVPSAVESATIEAGPA